MDGAANVWVSFIVLNEPTVGGGMAVLPGKWCNENGADDKAVGSRIERDQNKEHPQCHDVTKKFMVFARA